AVSGSVDRIAIYNGVLTDADVAALASGVTSTATVDVSPGQTAYHAGTWSDPGADVVSLSASMGQVSKNADGTWVWSLDTTNVATGTYLVSIVATDSDG